MSLERRKLQNAANVTPATLHQQMFQGGQLEINNTGQQKASQPGAQSVLHNYLNNGDVAGSTGRNRSNPARVSKNGILSPDDQPHLSKSVVSKPQTNHQNPGNFVSRFTPDLRDMTNQQPQASNKLANKKLPLTTSHQLQPSHLFHKTITQSPVPISSKVHNIMITKSEINHQD